MERKGDKETKMKKTFELSFKEIVVKEVTGIGKNKEDCFADACQKATDWAYNHVLKNLMIEADGRFYYASQNWKSR